MKIIEVMADDSSNRGYKLSVDTVNISCAISRFLIGLDIVANISMCLVTTASRAVRYDGSDFKNPTPTVSRQI